MCTYRYHQNSQMKSYPLLPGTDAYDIVCHHLGLGKLPNLYTIEEAFADNGWWFTFDENGIIALEGDDDQEIPDIEELQPIASIFADGSWLEWEVNGDHCRLLILNGEITYDQEARRLFPPDVFSHQSLDNEIAAVAEHLTALKQRRTTFTNLDCRCFPCVNCEGIEQADNCPDHNAVDCAA